jgi:hypothetical protein
MPSIDRHRPRPAASPRTAATDRTLPGPDSRPAPTNVDLPGRAGLPAAWTPAGDDRDVPLIGRGEGRRIRLPADADGGPALEIGASGRFLEGGRLLHEQPGRADDGALLTRMARRAASGGLFAELRLSSAMRSRVLGQLSRALEHSLQAPRGPARDGVFCATMTLIAELARATPRSDTLVRRAALDRILGGLEAQPDLEKVAFYLRSSRDLLRGAGRAERGRVRGLLERVLPQRPPVEAWTAGRTRPLVIRHTIHEEFWKEELAFFSRKNGFELIRKDAKDSHRTYRARLEDPNGRKAPLAVELDIRKGELDLLEGLGDPAVHVVMYSGHSALGANGSQSIFEGPDACVGEHPKLVFVATCRGKDNYAELTRKYPGLQAITTDHPTYSPSGQARLEALFAMLASGGTYREMRTSTEKKYWDGPADNYFYPDEWRRFSFTDLDGDGKLDISRLGSDRFFDVDTREGGARLVRAVNFANSELYYHWNVEKERGQRSFFGRGIGDSLVPDGPLRDPRPGERVRLVPTTTADGDGERRTRFSVRFAPGPAARTDADVYAAQVTMDCALTLARHQRRGPPRAEDVLRAAVMGAQAIHYLHVYEDTAERTMKSFLASIGAEAVDPRAVGRLFERFDGHADARQVAGFRKLLEAAGLKVEAWAARPLEVEARLHAARA